MHPIGGGKIELSKINDADVATLDKEFLELTYSDRERCETAPFVPDHVSLDKKVLHFKVQGSQFYPGGFVNFNFRIISFVYQAL